MKMEINKKKRDEIMKVIVYEKCGVEAHSYVETGQKIGNLVVTI